jgi:PLP dependent protein
MEQTISDVRARIAAAAQRAGRSASAITLLAVSKTHSAQIVRLAIESGLTRFGENRVQEAQQKFDEIAAQGLEFELRLIGHLQRNKCKSVYGLFHWVESLDSLRLARTLSERFAEAGGTCNVLLQLNSSGEQTKFGFQSGEALLDAAREICSLPGLVVRGVMTIGPFVEDTQAIRSSFRDTRAVFERLQEQTGDAGIDTLSMGMTHDFEIAIEEGSTEVRIGSALFGARGSHA